VLLQDGVLERREVVGAGVAETPLAITATEVKKEKSLRRCKQREEFEAKFLEPSIWKEYLARVFVKSN